MKKNYFLMVGILVFQWISSVVLYAQSLEPLEDISLAIAQENLYNTYSLDTSNDYLHNVTYKQENTKADYLGTELSFSTNKNRFSDEVPSGNQNYDFAYLNEELILGLEEENPLQSIKVFSITTKPFVEIQLPLSISEITVCIYDEMGRVLTMPQKIKNNDTLMLPYDNGIYFLDVRFNKFSMTRKIIKTNN
ncbi:MAG: T9SS type A sorting domain-containing protein [Flavobacteriaceae bacterium]